MEVFFDLDGTLTDSAPGITRCLQHALIELGRPVLALDALTRFIGVPLQQVFAELLQTDDRQRLARAVGLYRERFATTGMFENSVYANVTAGLMGLRGDGHRLWLVTSKPKVFAEKILDYFDLSRHFERVYGSELSGVNTEKADLIRDLLFRERLLASDACMVGDRAQDICGARANAVHAVAVTWGYGTLAELQNAHPDRIVTSMRELCEYLRR